MTQFLVQQASLWSPTMRTAGGEGVITGSAPIVEIDVFARNPLIDDMRQAVPSQYAQAVKRKRTVPTLFATSDLPLFTASGIDPSLLLQLPWVVRHAAASIAAGGEVSRLFEDFAPPGEESFEAALSYVAVSGWDQPNEAYLNRILDWGTVDPYEAQRRTLFGAAGKRAGYLTGGSAP